MKPARPQLVIFFPSEVIIHVFHMVCERGPWLDWDCFELQRVPGHCDGMKKVSHVTVSGNAVTREMVSHVSVSGCWGGMAR